MDRAIECYQKALTCVPRIFGVLEWFQRYLLDGFEPAHVTDAQVAEIYARMGQCLAALGRWDDAQLCIHAALTWNKADDIAGQLMICRPELKVIANASAHEAIPGHAEPFLESIRFIADRLTLLVITHDTKKLKKYCELSPPSDKLISATYGSMLQVFGDELATCPKLICYDQEANNTMDTNRYAHALEVFCHRHNFELCIFKQIGLRHILQQIVPHILTPYLMIVEHDWLFQGAKIDLLDLLAAFVRYPQVNLIRFNQRTNHIANYDFLMGAARHIRNVPLLRTVAHSNKKS